MTDRDSLNTIAELLSRWPGVSSAAAFRNDDGTVSIHFRCRDFESLKEISRCTVAANVPFSVCDPHGRMCYEAPDAVDCPFAIQIQDVQGQEGPPTTSQIFGIFLARSLKDAGLLDEESSHRLQAGWNAMPL